MFDKLIGEPIVNYYFNHLSLMDDIYAGFDEALACEIKSFKLTFRISGVFKASDLLDGYTYTAEQVHWNTNKDIINATLMQYKTSLSSKLLSIVETIFFMISRMLKINGKLRVFLMCSSSQDPLWLITKTITCVGIDSLFCVCILNCVMSRSS